ncbi:hypothetical protein BJY01DRAFT_247405 [Aspergillus pseudoustus]|uniref:F-box domain-containing protein n=1 Tax=Aspergillus pseudoustus TaxID=1810923 RepID=A0ABR4K1C3_9EURO
MAHPNTREMDVARSLLHMALPDDIQNAPANGQPEFHPNEFTARPATHRRIKRENNADNSVSFGTPRINYYQPALPHPQDPVRRWATVNNRPQNLRDHLIQQQVIAGITPDNFLPLNAPPVPQENVNQRRNPALLQITNDGVSVPHVQAATFTPQPSYTGMPIDDNEGGGFARQFLGLSDGRFGNRNCAFERPATALDMNTAGNYHGPYGAQLHPPTRPTSAHAQNFSPFAHDTHQPQGYYEPPIPPFQNFGTYAPDAHNQHGFSEAPTNIPNANGAGYIRGPYRWMVKPDPDARQGQQDPGQFTDFFGRKSGGNAQGLLAIPTLKATHFQVAPGPYMIGRGPTFAQHEEYGTGNTDGVEDVVRTVFDAKELPVARWNGLQQPNADGQQRPMFSLTAEANTPLNELAGQAENVKRHEGAAVVSHNFSIILAVLDHPEIALQVTGHLRVHDIMNLQASSRSFRAFVIKYLPRIIKLQTQCRLRTASYVFPWRCYQKLWYTRPAARTELPKGTTFCSNDSVVAYSASFRWLQMVRHREHTVYYIIKALESAGYGFPLRFKPAILKLWLLMDIPDMTRRVWTVRNPNLWRDLDLFGAIFFIIRLDMFVKLKRGNLTGGQRRLIMAQPSLTFCYEVLTGRALKDDMELLRALVRWRYNPPPEQMNCEEIFGVPLAEVGSLQYEEYGTGREKNVKLLRPDQLVLREAQRRHLDMKDMYQRIFIHAQEKMFTLCERHHSP